MQFDDHPEYKPPTLDWDVEVSRAIFRDAEGCDTHDRFTWGEFSWRVDCFQSLPPFQMNNLILVGDSVFDNRDYFAGVPAFIDQVQSSIAPDWKATLLAVDGNTSVQVPKQLNTLPTDCTHLVLSAVGNDAIGCLDLMGTPVPNLMGALGNLSKMLAGFEQSYMALLTKILSLNKPLMVCAIYDSVPGLAYPLKLSLALFNDIIIRNAVSRGVPIGPSYDLH